MPKPRRRGHLICFIGVDGAGKSTQAHNLIHSLRSDGVPTRHVDNRFEHWALLPFVKIGKATVGGSMNYPRDDSQPAGGTRRGFLSRSLGRVYLSYVVFLQVVHSMLKINTPLARGQTVVCERYCYDVLARLTIELGYSGEQMARFLTRLRRFFPRPSLVILIDVPPETAYGRKDDIPSPAFVAARREAYSRIAELEDAVVVDGAATPAEVWGQVRVICQNKLGVPHA